MDNLENAVKPTEVPKKPRKRRFGDRPDGRRLRTISPMAMVSPFIMYICLLHQSLRGTVQQSL